MLSCAGKAQNSLILIDFRNKTGSGARSHVTISARASSCSPVGFRENPGEGGRTPPNCCPPCCRLGVSSGASSHITISARASLRGPIGFSENPDVAGRTPPYGCPPCYQLRVLSTPPRLSVPCVPVSLPIACDNHQGCLSLRQRLRFWGLCRYLAGDHPVLQSWLT